MKIVSLFISKTQKKNTQLVSAGFDNQLKKKNYKKALVNADFRKS